jgi:hypothetical protein
MALVAFTSSTIEDVVSMDRRKAGKRVGRLAARHSRADEKGAGRSQDDRVSIGRRIGDLLAADGATRTATIFHDDRLPEPPRQRFGEQAAGDVGISARREGHDEADRLVGIVLGTCRKGQGSGHEKDGATTDFHDARISLPKCRHDDKADCHIMRSDACCRLQTEDEWPQSN